MQLLFPWILVIGASLACCFCGNPVTMQGSSRPVKTAPGEATPASTPENASQPEPEAIHLPVPNVVEGPSDIVPPQNVTGAFLVSCRWELKGLVAGCMVQAGGGASAPRATQVAFQITQTNGVVVDPSAYQMLVHETSAGLSFEIRFLTPMPEVSLQFAGTTAGSAPPVRVEASKLEQFSQAVLAYAEPDFKGESKLLPLGYHTKAQDFPEFSSSFASIRVPQGLAVELCYELDQVPFCHSYYGDLPKLWDMHQAATSVRVYESAPFVTAFLHFFLAGVSVNFGIGAYPYADIPLIIRDQISSFHVPEGLRVDACFAPDGSSECQSYGPGDFNLDDRNDRNKFILVRP